MSEGAGLARRVTARLRPRSALDWALLASALACWLLSASAGPCWGSRAPALHCVALFVEGSATDPWGRPFARTPLERLPWERWPLTVGVRADDEGRESFLREVGPSPFVYSLGPNGVDEGTLGDDVLIGVWDARPHPRRLLGAEHDWLGNPQPRLLLFFLCRGGAELLAAGLLLLYLAARPARIASLGVPRQLALESALIAPLLALPCHVCLMFLQQELYVPTTPGGPPSWEVLLFERLQQGRPIQGLLVQAALPFPLTWLAILTVKLTHPAEDAGPPT